MTEKLLSRILYFCMAIGAIGCIVIAFAECALHGFVSLIITSLAGFLFLAIRQTFKEENDHRHRIH